LFVVVGARAEIAGLRRDRLKQQLAVCDTVPSWRIRLANANARLKAELQATHRAAQRAAKRKAA
jgi:hypothetical protein